MFSFLQHIQQTKHSVFTFFFPPHMQFQQRTTARSRCQRGPVQNMFCSGTSTLAQGNAGRLCTGAVAATETDSPQDKSVRAGVG